LASSTARIAIGTATSGRWGRLTAASAAFADSLQHKRKRSLDRGRRKSQSAYRRCRPFAARSTPKPLRRCLTQTGWANDHQSPVLSSEPRSSEAQPEPAEVQSMHRPPGALATRSGSEPVCGALMRTVGSEYAGRPNEMVSTGAASTGGGAFRYSTSDPMAASNW